MFIYSGISNIVYLYLLYLCKDGYLSKFIGSFEKTLFAKYFI